MSAADGEIKFTKEEREALVKIIQGYFRDELDQELGQFPAGFLLDFFTEQIGPHYYNRALLDAQAVVELRAESIVEAIDGLSRSAPALR